jgi:hypothetical protein
MAKFEPIQDRLPNDTAELENEEEKDQSHRVQLLSKDSLPTTKLTDDSLE